MAKIIKQYKETNENGEYSIKEFSNGIIVKSLTKPSEKYKNKIIENKKAQEIKKAEKKKAREREKLIQDRMKEIAIRELKEEGKL